MQFNKEQIEVINFDKGNCAVIAGAGSGKSTCLVNRIKKLVECGTNEDDIVAITFTKNSANDLKKKLSELNISNVCVGTFHSICAKILSKKGVMFKTGMKEYEVENLFKKISSDRKIKYKDILSFISYQKNHMVGCDDIFVEYNTEYSEDELRDFYKEYEKFKEENNYMDFDDLLLKAYSILQNDKDIFNCKYLIVDEAQDNNLIQNKLLNLLCKENNIMLIGDYRQCIYGFRGSKPEEFMNFKNILKDCKVINLSDNYRSKENIVKNANEFIKKYYGYYEHYSDSRATNNINGQIKYIDTYTSEEEAKKVVDEIEKLIKNNIKKKEISVLYRLNSQSNYIENELKLRNIKYNIHNSSSFFKRKEIHMIMCVLRLIKNPSDDLAYEDLLKGRIIPFMPKKVIEEIITKASRLNISFLGASEIVDVKNYYLARNIKEFSQNIDKLIRQQKMGVTLLNLVDNIIKLIKLEDWIECNYNSDEEIKERLETVENFKKFLRENTLESFLVYVYEKSSTQKKETDDDAVQLMTLHGSKGLEFDNVFIVGLNDGKFPNNKTSVLDEARLMYVGVTRAKSNLWLSTSEDSLFIDEYKGLSC